MQQCVTAIILELNLILKALRWPVGRQLECSGICAGCVLLWLTAFIIHMKYSLYSVTVATVHSCHGYQMGQAGFQYQVTLCSLY